MSKATSVYFPYPTIRPQQQQIMDHIEQCVEEGNTAIIEAATGIGKTVAVLSPLLQYLRQHNTTAEQEDRFKLVVVGRTHSQADRVIDELIEIEAQTDQRIAAISKRGKQSLCINEEVKTQSTLQFQAVCSAYKKQKKCKPFVNAMIEDNTSFTQFLTDIPVTSSQIINDSRANNCCPAEITNKLIKGVDIIACSYHYLFSDSIRQRFLQQLEVPLENLIIVIDECHNLPDATVQMNTIRLSGNQVKAARMEISRSNFNKEEVIALRDRYSTMVDALLQVMTVEEEQTVTSLDLIKEIEKKMAQQGHNVMLKPEIVDDLRMLADAYLQLSSIRHFSYIEYIADTYEMLFKLLSRKDELILLYRYQEKNYIELKVMDPKYEISKVIKNSRFSVLMTGTLGNPYVFRAQTGLYDDISVLQLPSPYEQELGVYLVDGLSSKYTRRSPEMYQQFVEVIHDICKAPVNIGLYVTSYAFLDKLFEHGLDRITKPIFRAERKMNSAETERMLQHFRAAKLKQGGLLCSVMGGRSSEGTDFPGDDMEIIIIAGVPYPPKTIEQEAKFNYYSTLTKSAWNICYSTPAFRSINQAAGRAVRSLTDRALVFLLDDRIRKDRKRLTGWLQTGFEIIQSDQINRIVETYF